MQSVGNLGLHGSENTDGDLDLSSSVLLGPPPPMPVTQASQLPRLSLPGGNDKAPPTILYTQVLNLFLPSNPGSTSRTSRLPIPGNTGLEHKAANFMLSLEHQDRTWEKQPCALLIPNGSGALWGPEGAVTNASAQCPLSALE